MKNTTGAVRTRLAGKAQFYLICFTECNELNTADRPGYNHRAARVKFMTTTDGCCINRCDGSVFGLLFARNQTRDLLQPSDLLESRQSGAGFYKWCSDRKEKRLRKQELGGGEGRGGFVHFWLLFKLRICVTAISQQMLVSTTEKLRVSECRVIAAVNAEEGKHKRRLWKVENVPRPIDHHPHCGAGDPFCTCAVKIPPLKVCVIVDSHVRVKATSMG